MFQVCCLILLMFCVLNAKCTEGQCSISCECDQNQYATNRCYDSLQTITCSNLSTTEAIPLSNVNYENRYGYYRYNNRYGQHYENNSCMASLLLKDSVITSTSEETFSQYPSAEYLDLHHNNIEDIQPGTFDKLHELISLDLSDNQITIIKRGMFNSNHKLKILQLERNNIGQIEPFSFLGCINLEKIYLMNNNLSEISPTQFDNLNKLTELDISNNNLKIFSLNSTIMKNLVLFNLSHNHLERFELGEEVNPLASIDISNNEIKIFQMSNTSYDFRILYVSNNSLETFKFYNAMNIANLDLSNNYISHFNVPYLSYEKINLDNNHLENMIETRNEQKSTSLELHSEIHLRGNKIRKLIADSNYNNTKMFSMDVSYNSISSIARNYFSTMSNLRELHLQHNQIQKVDVDLFRSLSYLEYLDLSSNNVKNFPQGTFSTLNHLRKLNISNNQLIEIHHDLALATLQGFYFDKNLISSLDTDELFNNFKHLNEISLDGNLWHCDGLIKIYRKITDKGIKILAGHSFNVENIQGIACNGGLEAKENLTESSRFNKDSIDQLMEKISVQFERKFDSAFDKSEFNKYFQKDYRNSNFFKYLDSYKFVHVRSENNNDTANNTNNGFSALKIEQEPEHHGQDTISVFILLVLMVIALSLLTILYFIRLLVIKDRNNYNNDNKSRVSQMELCEHAT